MKRSKDALNELISDLLDMWPPSTYARHISVGKHLIDRLISAVSEQQKREEKTSCAGLIHQVASPLVETLPRPTCANPAACNEACEDVDGLSYCLRCGLWDGCRR